MPLGKHSAPEENQRKADDAASLRSLQAGSLPLQAQRRLSEETAQKDKFFTSDLSINEFFLTRQQGCEPLGQVMGSSIYHVGWQRVRSSSLSTMSSELTTLSGAHQQAAQLALNRLKQEAEALKAHGVIGVRFTRRSYEWGKDLVEYTAIGTAIRLPKGLRPNATFLSDLSGQEFWTLLQAGYNPVGLAMGYCSYFVSLGEFKTQLITSTYYDAPPTNRMVTPFAKAISTARKLAMKRVVTMARIYKAAGIVGLHIDCERKMLEHNDNLNLMVHFAAIGTAISTAGKKVATPAPSSILTFTDLPRPMKKGDTRIDP